jgi:ATP-dependent 26S proteasome regulatory subunit
MSSNAGFRPQEIQRRQFQVAAAAALDRQAQAIQATREFMADLSVRIDTLEQKATGLDAEVGGIQNALTRDYRHWEAVCLPLCNSTLWTRLRWLLLGQ